MIRFAKFVAAVLAIIIAVGVILYGIDIKQAAKDAEESANNVRELANSMKDLQRAALDTRDAIQKEKEAVGSDRSQVEKQLQDTKEAESRTLKIAAELDGAKKEVIATEQQAKDLLVRAEQYVDSIAKDAAKAHNETVRGATGPTPTKPFSVPELATFYNFPTEFNGRGQTIGLIELAGGYTISDIDSYFQKLNLSKPEIATVSVDGALNAPGSTADSEVTLDIEVAGAIAPAANIVVYFAPNTNQGFIDAVQTAVSDTGHRLTVLSISWGQPESMWTQSSLSALDQEFQKAADLGLTVVTAAGDGGVTDNVKDNRPHVDFPSSSPWVLAVGGTKIIGSDSRITSEVAWNDSTTSFVAATGGGVSEVFPLPAWQTGINVPLGNSGRPGRGIPDVAANASPDSGYEVYIHGNYTQIGGTAAAAPFWGGLVAIINQGLGHNVGYINPVLYKKLGPEGVLRNITQGNNSVGDVKGYSAGLGWNAVTGWGSPDGRKLLKALQDEATSHD